MRFWELISGVGNLIDWLARFAEFMDFIEKYWKKIVAVVVLLIAVIVLCFVYL